MSARLQDASATSCLRRRQKPARADDVLCIAIRFSIASMAGPTELVAFVMDLLRSLLRVLRGCVAAFHELGADHVLPRRAPDAFCDFNPFSSLGRVEMGRCYVDLDANDKMNQLGNAVHTSYDSILAHRCRHRPINSDHLKYMAWGNGSRTNWLAKSHCIQREAGDRLIEARTRC
jgi:hypothetical protein